MAGTLSEADIAMLDYQFAASDIEREAAEPRFRNMPLSIRRMRVQAAIARRAALAERDNPAVPEPEACSICGRTRSCLAVR